MFIVSDKNTFSDITKVISDLVYVGILFFKLQALDGLFLVLYPMPRILVPGGALGIMVRKTIMVKMKINLISPYDLYSDILNCMSFYSYPKETAQKVLSGIQVTLITWKCQFQICHSYCKTKQYSKFK